MVPNVGFGELVVVLIIALLVLGPKRLPEAGRSLGRGLREFKDSISGPHRDELEELPASAHAHAHPLAVQDAGAVREPPPPHPLAGTGRDDSPPVRSAGAFGQSPPAQAAPPQG